jgi:hypothetical protein
MLLLELLPQSYLDVELVVLEFEVVVEVDHCHS